MGLAGLGPGDGLAGRARHFREGPVAVVNAEGGVGVFDGDGPTGVAAADGSAESGWAFEGLQPAGRCGCWRVAVLVVARVPGVSGGLAGRASRIRDLLRVK
ncbi:hypothetical protein GCM10027259_52260 [Micromonospora palomenae]